jgi:uncharacterized protein (TIGR00730 family)
MLTTNSKKPILNQEQQFLEGPHSRGREFIFTLKVVGQFIKAFRTMHFVGPCVTVFGSARLKEDHPDYQLSLKVGEEIANRGLTVMTGGGPGIMEAANRGAKNVNGHSVGCNIKLPYEQQPNPYLDTYLLFDHFFVRKVVLVKYSYAFIILPGGFGTLDELFETMTLIQTERIHNFPVVIMNKEFHHTLIAHMKNMAQNGLISLNDIDRIFFTDDPIQAVDHIESYIKKNYKIKRKWKPLWWFGEK